MKQYSVYQIPVTKQMYNALNQYGWSAAAEHADLLPYKVKQDLQVCGYKEYQPEMFKYFNLVAKVDAEDIEEVFSLTNRWDKPERVTRYTTMHSVSVGDIIFDGKDWHMVDSFGFKQIAV